MFNADIYREKSRWTSEIQGFEKIEIHRRFQVLNILKEVCLILILCDGSVVVDDRIKDEKSRDLFSNLGHKSYVYVIDY